MVPHSSSFETNSRQFYSCALSDLALIGNEAGGDIVLLQTSLQYLCCVYQVVFILLVCIYDRKAERFVSKQGHL